MKALANQDCCQVLYWGLGQAGTNGISFLHKPAPTPLSGGWRRCACITCYLSGKCPPAARDQDRDLTMCTVGMVKDVMGVWTWTEKCLKWNLKCSMEITVEAVRPLWRDVIFPHYVSSGLIQRGVTWLKRAKWGRTNVAHGGERVLSNHLHRIQPYQRPQWWHKITSYWWNKLPGVGILSMRIMGSRGICESPTQWQCWFRNFRRMLSVVIY